MNKKILHIAIPSIISNITVPLLALVDTTIAGHLGKAAYIGAIAVGGMLFNMAYWLFGFLRMGTGGLTAQAYGAGNQRESMLVLLRSLSVAIVVSAVLIVLQRPIIELAFRFITATPEVAQYAHLYFNILIWGAPAVLGLYGFTGWFLGMQNARVPMAIAIMQNVVNIVVSALLVLAFGWKVEGIAAGTLVAQYAGFLTAVVVFLRKYRPHLPHVRWREVTNRVAFKKFFGVNRDIFFRTFCLIAVSSYFTTAGSTQGELTLAANTLLMQFFTLFSYLFDGFSYAGEAIGGQYYGAKNREEFCALTRSLFKWGIGLVIAFTLVYIAFGNAILSLLTDSTAVLAQAANYLPYAYCIPLVSFCAFLYDGLFIGSTATRYMLISMLAASVLFFVIISAFPLTNHVLWGAFLAYLGCRGVVQAFLYPKLTKKMLKTCNDRN